MPLARRAFAATCSRPGVASLTVPVTLRDGRGKKTTLKVRVRVRSG